jgi:uncharacterized membrane protein
LFPRDFDFSFNLIIPLWSLLRLAVIPPTLFLMYKALRRERFSLPLIGSMAANLAG